MIYLQLFWAYFKVGLFGFGGGYAILSMIQFEVVERYGWLTDQEFTDIVAISQMTPGPIGINTATYVGYTATGGVLGSALATFAICLPSFLLALTISYYLIKYKDSPYLVRFFKTLSPVTVGLIASAALYLATEETFFDYTGYLLFAAALLLSLFTRLHPILMIILAGVAGIILY